MKHRPVAWLTHAECRLHDMGPDHPESPARLDAIEDRLRAMGILDFLWRVEAPEATREQLLRAHDAAHVDAILAGADSGQPRVIDADTMQMHHTLAAALRAAGASVRAVDLVLEGRASLAFCAVRPPGHHAERHRAMGFCFFDNVAVGASHALARGCRRVAVLDFDVHYGNGTVDIFSDDDRVVVYQSYQFPLYPNFERPKARANLVDVPLPAGCGSETFRTAVAGHWLPRLEAQRPDLILVSAGFDAHERDPRGGMRLGIGDFRWLGAMVRDVAESCCDGRVVATLEGGYDTFALARSVEFFLQPFLGL